MKMFSWHSLKQSTMQFMIVQLFLTLVSLPIIIAWGLPISLLSPVGNFIFSPFLTLFLLLSSIIFFTQMIGIPNQIAIWLLEKVMSVWNYALTFSSSWAMCAFKKPPLLVLITIPLLTLFLSRHPRLHTPKNKLAGLCAMTIFTWMLLSFWPTEKNWIKTIDCNNGFVTLIRHNGKTTLIDAGMIGRKISAPSWISYTLIPEITKLTGSLKIDSLIFTRLNKIQFDAMQTLATKIAIDKIYMPAFQGDLEPHIKKSFNRFYATARGCNAEIIRLYTQPITIIDDTLSICIAPTKKELYRTIEYTSPTITALIDNNEVPIYSRKQNTFTGV